MPSYQIDTRIVPVEIDLGGGRRLRGEVFLHGGAASHAGDENIVDLMNDDSPFFPVRVSEPEPGTVLVAKAHVHFMRVPSLGGDERVAMERDAAVRFDVTLELDDGEAVTGAVFAELPPGRRRALDYLNAKGSAFLVVVQSAGDILVNRARVQVVRDTVRLSE